MVFSFPFSPVFGPSSRAIATQDNWWLAGGVSAADCIFAYQPKGAASYAASLSNLNIPGTGDATEGTTPDWDGTNGWRFSETDLSFLVTPTIARGADFTVIIRFANASSNTQVIYGDNSWPYEWPLLLIPGFGSSATWTNDNNHTETGVSGGVMALAGYTAYLDGEAVGTISSGSGTMPSNGYHYIGAMHVDESVFNHMVTGDVQAVSAYGRALSSIEIAAITSAMEVL